MACVARRRAPKGGRELEVKRTGGTFYGWYLAALAFFLGFTSGAVYLHSRGVLVRDQIIDFDVSRADISYAFTAAQAAGLLFAPLLGVLLDRYPIRNVMAAGAAWLGIGFFAMAEVDDIVAFGVVTAVFVGLGTGTIGTTANSKLMVNWFDRRRGLAFGIAITGYSVAGIVAAPVAVRLLDTVGWRGSYRLFGLFCLLVVLPLVWRLVKQRPADIGAHFDGAPGDDPVVAATAAAPATAAVPSAATPAVPSPAAAAVPSAETPAVPSAAAAAIPRATAAHSPIATSSSPPDPRPSLRAMLASGFAAFPAIVGSKPFWGVVLVFGLADGIFGALNLHLFLHYLQVGIDDYRAALILSVTAGCAIVAKPLFGMLIDRFGARAAALTAMVACLVAMAVLIAATAYTALLVAAAISGLAFGGMVPLRAALLSRLFDAATFGRAYGAFKLCIAPVTLAWTPIMGHLYDATGSYVPAFRVLLAAFVVAIVATWRLVRLPEPVTASRAVRRPSPSSP